MQTFLVLLANMMVLVMVELSVIDDMVALRTHLTPAHSPSPHATSTNTTTMSKMTLVARAS